MTSEKRLSSATAGNDFIHKFVPGSGRRVLLLLHGTGGNEDSLLPIGRELDGEASLLSARGKVLENGMPRFFRRFAEGVFDIPDLKYRAGELADFVAWASKEYGFAAGSAVSVGYSNGANVAAGMLLLRPESIRAAVLFRPTLPFEPGEFPPLSTKSVFVSSGRLDPLVTEGAAMALVDVLTESGAKVDLNLEDATHSLNHEEIAKARSWLEALD